MAIKPVKISRLRHQVKIQSLVGAAPDAFGQRTGGAWTDLVTTRAEIGPIKSGEIERAHSFGGQTNTKVTIRYRAGVTRAMRMIYAGAGVTRTFLINGIVNPDERNVLLELYCQELT